MDRSARLLRTSNREKSDTNKDPYTRQRNSHHPELDIVEKICYQSHPLRSPPHPNTSRSQHGDRPGEDSGSTATHRLGHQGRPTPRHEPPSPRYPSNPTGDPTCPPPTDRQPCQTGP